MNLWFRMLRVFLSAKRRQDMSLWDTAVTHFRVTLGDLDTVGHMNNGRYLTLLDLGRTDLMLRSGFWKQVKGHGWFPVVAGLSITYWKDLKLGQQFDIHSKILGIDDRWFYLEQSFMRGETVHARAVIRGCFVEPGKGRVSTEALTALLGELPEHLEVPDWVRSWTTQSSSTHR